MRFINSVDKARYRNVFTDLENSFVKGNDGYPKNTTGAYNMLANWMKTTVHQDCRSNDELYFAQGGSPSNENHGEDLKTAPKCSAADVVSMGTSQPKGNVTRRVWRNG